jgi:hypothetical protein
MRNADLFAWLPKQKKLSREEAERALTICNLLNAMRETFGMGDIDSFRAAGLAGPYCRYLHDLLLVPDTAVAFYRAALLPGSAFRAIRAESAARIEAPA